MNINKMTIDYDNKMAELYHVVFDNFSDFKDSIDSEIVDIMYGNNEYDLGPTKKELFSFIQSKTIEQKYVTVAEFFSHITLRRLGYTQQCLFTNLEESSMKKGFDGLYALGDEFWLAESKSAYTTSTHLTKIKEAIQDLKNKVEVVGKNNPWMNAVHHILVMENGKRNYTIKTRIRDLSVEYQRGKPHKLEDFNIIPMSTLFINNTQDINAIESQCATFLQDKNYNKIIIVCLDNYIYESFLEYLEN